MKFKPTLGRWLWAYPTAAVLTIVLMYSWSGSGFFAAVVNLAGVILLITGVLIFYALLLTRYELSENELIIRYGLSGPLRIPYSMIRSVKIKIEDDPLDLFSIFRNVMLLEALEITYSIGKKTRSVVLISPKDNENFRTELEKRLRSSEADSLKGLQYEV